MAFLALPGELYLHAHDDSGRLRAHRSSIEIGLAGAALIHLWLAGRIDLVDGLVVVAGTEPTGDPLCDRFLAAIQSLDNLHAARTWMGWLNEGAYERVRARMVELGVLRAIPTRRLGLAARPRFGVVDEGAVVQSHARTRYAVLGFERPDAATAALCGLIAVLRLEAGLYVSLPAAEVLGRLETIGRTSPPEVQELVTAVDATVAATSVALYRP